MANPTTIYTARTVKSKKRMRSKSASIPRSKIGAKTSFRKESIASPQQAILNSCELAAKKVRNLAKAVYECAILYEQVGPLCKTKADRLESTKLVEKFDETLALMARNLSTFISIRAEKTKSAELLFHVYGETLGNMERFASVWRRCITTDADANSSDSPGFWFLTALTKMVRLFEDECENRPQLFRHWAQEQPALPMLVFQNKAAYHKRFKRLAASVELGLRCPINVSPRANYSLESPLNLAVFNALMDFIIARDWIEFVMAGDPEKAWRPGATVADQLAEQAGIPRELHPVYFAAYDLSPLVKATAQTWADVFVVPYMEVSGVDFQVAPEFAAVRRRKRVKSPSTLRAEIRKDVIRALVGLARPSAPNSPHS